MGRPSLAPGVYFRLLLLGYFRGTRTHLAHKAAHGVDLDTGAVVAVTVQDADDGDTTTMQATLIAAAAHLEMVLPADNR